MAGRGAVSKGWLIGPLGAGRGGYSYSTSLLLVVIVLVSAAFATTSCRGDSGGVYDHLSKNYQVLDLNDLESFRLMDPYLELNDLFMAGELHNIPENMDIEPALLEHLVLEAGVRYYIPECQFSSAAFMQIFLETADVSFLERAYGREIKPNEPLMRKWRRIQGFWASLPPEKSFQVIGLDVEHSVSVSLDYLSYLISTQSTRPSDTIAPMLAEIQALSTKEGSSPELVTDFITRFHKDATWREELYQKFFGGDYFSFSMVEQNLYNRLEVHAPEELPLMLREGMIIENFRSVYFRYPRGKYFGQWGSFHAWESGFAGQLRDLPKHKLPIGDRVLSITYLYKDCVSYTTGQPEPVTDYYGIRGTVIKAFDELASDARFTLFRLVGEDSPFQDGPILSLVETRRPTADFTQFIVVIRGSGG